MSQAAQSTKESVVGAAQSLGAAAGFGGSDPGAFQPPPTMSKTVYVGNLFFDVRAEDLRREFGRAGTVLDSKIIMDNRGLSKGCVTHHLPAHLYSILSKKIY